MKIRIVGGVVLSTVILFAVLLASRPEITQVDARPASRMPEQADTVAGLDVSHYQGRVDWQSVRAAGIGFAYIKATSGNSYVDPRHGENAREADAADVVAGAYHYFEPDDDALEQARHFIRAIESRPGRLPPALDLERTPAGNHEKYRRAVLDWLGYVKQATGCKPVIYSDPSFWERYLGTDFDDYPLWLADYAPKPRLPTNVSQWHIWQHEDNGRVTGIGTPVDLDRFNGSHAELDAFRCRTGT